MTHDVFAAEVARAFEYLETEFGLRREPMHRDGRHAWVVYANVDVKVIVEHEENAYCGVSVQNLRYVKHDALERSEFDLDEIMAAARPQQQQRRQEWRSSPEALRKAAELLKSVGGPVLRGDFEALHTRQRRTVETLRRYNPPIEGEPVVRK